MDKIHNIKNIKIDGDIMIITIDKTEHNINLCDHSARITSASIEQRTNFIVSPSGYGIHWPDLDEDLSIDGLIGIKHSIPMNKETYIPRDNTDRIVADNKIQYK